MPNQIVIKTKQREFSIEEGKPVIIRWHAKNKQRPGICVALGWIKPGEKPHTITLVHQAFSTWDQAETEYPSKWTIWMSQIVEIHPLKRTV